MNKEINHRYGFYLMMLIVIGLLSMIYLEVIALRSEVENISKADQMSVIDYSIYKDSNKLSQPIPTIDLEKVSF